MIIGYVRVSSVDQNESRQLETMKEYEVEKIFMEKVSTREKRNELERALEFAREGDKFVVHDFSRLARSTKELLEISEKLKTKGVELISKKENIRTSDAAGKLMLTMIGAIYEFERDNSRERQLEGIAIAKAEGKYKGRSIISVDNFRSHYKRYITREISKIQLAKELSISRPTLDRLFKEYEKSVELDKE